MSDLVSILIPAYNAQRWIAGAIDSALAQSWPHKEVIVVDDGSTDNTFKVAMRFASKGVRVVAQANQGAASARNTALNAAQGSYLQFLDADDLLHPHKLSLQLAGAEHGTRSHDLLTSAWGRFFVHPQRAVFSQDALWQNQTPVEWIVTKFLDNTFMFPASWLVSRRLIEIAGPWNERLSADDDGEYMCRLVAASQQVRFVPRAQSYYRIGNATSLSSQKSEASLRSEMLSTRLCIEHLLRLEDSERTRRACVRLLQEKLTQFYPEQTELVEQCHRLAHTLDGALIAPAERLHFKLLRSVFGWHRAKAMRSRLNNTKLRVRRTMDRLSPAHDSVH
jgi:glycosyltransferase involved in cell wall biosynthesis